MGNNISGTQVVSLGTDELAFVLSSGNFLPCWRTRGDQLSLITYVSNRCAVCAAFEYPMQVLFLPIVHTQLLQSPAFPYWSRYHWVKGLSVGCCNSASDSSDHRGSLPCTMLGSCNSTSCAWFKMTAPSGSPLLLPLYWPMLLLGHLV